VNTAPQDDVVEEVDISMRLGRALPGLQMLKEALTGANLLIEKVGHFMRKEVLYKIEFDEEEDTDIAGFLDGQGEPMEK
jgi:hypothetical protein